MFFIVTIVFKDFIFNLCVSENVFMYATWGQVPQRPEGGIRSPRSGVTGGCEPLNTGN